VSTACLGFFLYAPVVGCVLRLELLDAQPALKSAKLLSCSLLRRPPAFYSLSPIVRCVSDAQNVSCGSARGAARALRLPPAVRSHGTRR
jgi:hypothetical protein